jgi:hypothetical protein
MGMYRKRPVAVEAIQWNGKNYHEIKALGGRVVSMETNERLIIATLEGDHIANLNDYIIKGVKGELYPCKPDIFELTYEEM